MSWMSWLPTLQGFLFGLAAFFALACLIMEDRQNTETFFQKFGVAICAAVLVAYAVSVH
jgi:hypothetical protein